MSRCVCRLKRWVRKRGEQLQCTYPEDCRYEHRFWCELELEEVEKKVLISVEGSTATMVSQSYKLTTRSCIKVQKKEHDKFVESFLLKCPESFGWCFRQTKKRDRSMWQNTWQLKENRQPSSDRPPRKAANQTRMLSDNIRVSKPWSEP